ncbi:alpha-amylase family protein [Streptosporangium subroseum]|uniref:alpha-amylase family protein n=1 Tax=Streptosporangium subroseum TaxID=106412 RepID=UPI00342BA91A
MASWVDHAIWWHVYPLGFTGAESTAQPHDAPVRHRLRQLEPWLDYVLELGCSGLMLGPVFASETHGYDTVDHFKIDPRLGDDEDFDRLIAAARDRGLRIVLDGVFNHVGRGFPVFARATGPNPDPDAARWFRRLPANDATGGAADEAEDGATGSVEPDYATFEGHHRLVALNHEEPAVLDHVAKVMIHWLDRGVSGWRLDAAYAMPARFWHEVLALVRPHHPDAWFVGEMIHGEYAAYVAESGLDSVTEYELWKAIWSSLNDGNLFELAWTLKRHDDLLGDFTPLTFVGNHDVTRLASRLADERHLGHALAVLFTVGGVPSVYYGDEQAFRGIKEDRVGGDDEIRPAFPARPDDLAPHGLPAYRLHQRLIALRRRHPWLVRARTTSEHLTNLTVALTSTAGNDGAGNGEAGNGGVENGEAGNGGGEGRGPRIVTLLNIGDEPYRFPVETEGLTIEETSATSHPGDPALVPAHGWTVLSDR